MDWRKSSKSRCFRSSRDKNIVLIQSFVKRERDLSRREYIDLFNSSPGKRRSITIETKPFVELENRRKFHLISCRRKVNLRSSFSDRRFVFVIFRTDRGRRLFVNWKNKSSEFSRMKQSSMKFSIRRKRRKKNLAILLFFAEKCFDESSIWAIFLLATGRDRRNLLIFLEPEKHGASSWRIFPFR